MRWDISCFGICFHHDFLIEIWPWQLGVMEQGHQGRRWTLWNLVFKKPLGPIWDSNSNRISWCVKFGPGPRSPNPPVAPNSAAMLFQEALPVVASSMASQRPALWYETAGHMGWKHVRLQLQTSHGGKGAGRLPQHSPKIRSGHHSATSGISGGSVNLSSPDRSSSCPRHSSPASWCWHRNGRGWRMKRKLGRQSAQTPGSWPAEGTGRARVAHCPCSLCRSACSPRSRCGHRYRSWPLGGLELPLMVSKRAQAAKSRDSSTRPCSRPILQISAIRLRSKARSCWSLC